MICHGSRAVGMFSKISSVNVPPVVVFLVSTTGAAAVTVSSSVDGAELQLHVDLRLEPGVMTHALPNGLLEAGSART